MGWGGKEAGLDTRDTLAPWPGSEMQTPWSEQVLGSNPRSVCPWECGFGQSMSLSLHFLSLLQSEAHTYPKAVKRT